MKYDPVMCMMVDDSVKTNDELSLAQKKQVVTELKGFLKKSYNFSDESEYARAYEDIRQMFTTGSRKSISGLFENAVKKTGSHDEKSKNSKTLDHAIRSCDEDKDRYEVVKIGEFLYGIYDNMKKKVVIESTKTGIESYSKMFNAKNLNNPRKI